MAHCWLLQVQHACIVAAQAKQVGELRLNSPPRWRELPKPHVFDLFYIDSLLRFARKKNTIRSFTIISSMGTQWRKGLSLPRRRLWEYSWKVVCQRAAESWETDIERRYEIGFQASMKCTWATHGQSLDCSLWMDYWVRFCEAFTSIRLWPGRTQTDPYLCQPFDCNNKMGGLLWEEGLGLLASPNCLISGKCRLVKLV